MVVATLHGRHQTSAGFSYEDLYALVRNYHPDCVGVEIRAEDMARDADYLAANYPKEMIALAREWGPKSFGFDWLGDDVAGAPIAPDWWTSRSPLKRLERELDQDVNYHDAQLDAIRAQQMKIIEAATPATLNDGRYDELNDAYYREFNRNVARSKYQAIASFYAGRDEKIGHNIQTGIVARRANRIVIVMGADHRSFAIRNLKKAFGSSLVLVPVSAAQ
jgi:hypothetical protein